VLTLDTRIQYRINLTSKQTTREIHKQARRCTSDPFTGTAQIHKTGPCARRSVGGSTVSVSAALRGDGRCHSSIATARYTRQQRLCGTQQDKRETNKSRQRCTSDTLAYPPLCLSGCVRCVTRQRQTDKQTEEEHQRATALSVRAGKVWCEREG